MSEFDGLPVLRTPVAVAAFEGWNDAADASTAAVEHLEQVWDARPLAELDPEEFYDFQVNRPTVTLVDGETRRIEWPTTRFAVASPPGAECDVVLIRGIEPSMRWRTFCEEVLELCHSLERAPVVLLGALLADVPYTRPLPISGSAYDDGVGRAVRPDRDPVRGPDRHRRRAAGRLRAGRASTAVSFWVHVPHYANNPPCPKATLALLHRVEEVLDMPVPLADLAEEAGEWEKPSTRWPPRTTSWPSTSASWRSAPARPTRCRGSPATRSPSEFERYLRRRRPPRSGGTGG